MAETKLQKVRQGVIQKVMAAHCRGDYNSALQAAEKLRQIDPPSHAYFRGSMLMQVGQLEEAEHWLRVNVAGITDNRLAAIGCSTLGQLLLCRQRFDLAMDCFDVSLTLWPDRGSTYRNMAEGCLLRGDPPENAMKWARLALGCDRRMEAASPESHDLNVAEDNVTLAWAIALESRDRTEVDRLVTEAMSLVGTKVIPAVAQVNYLAGMAYTGLGELERASRYFETAASVDPRGMWGRAAREVAGRQQEISS